MTKHNFDAKIARIHNRFNVPTPQVLSISNAIVATLLSTDKAGSLHIILGKTGSGRSTAIQLCRKRLQRNLKNVIVLRPSPLDEEFNPWRLLLQYYGLDFDESDLKIRTSYIPPPVIDLIELAEIDCIVFEDFSENLYKSADKQKAVEAWLSIALHTVCVDVILSTHDTAYAKRFANEESVTIHRIDEWNDDQEFSLFIGELQYNLQTKFKITVNLSVGRDQLYKLCDGNTGNLLNLVREYAVAELLSPSFANSDVAEYLSLKNMVGQNAILFAVKSSQR